MFAYELGYRAQPSDAFSWDLALFYNKHDKLLVRRVTPPPFVNVLPTFPIATFNGMDGETYGVELAATWDVRFPAKRGSVCLVVSVVNETREPEMYAMKLDIDRELSAKSVSADGTQLVELLIITDPTTNNVSLTGSTSTDVTDALAAQFVDSANIAVDAQGLEVIEVQPDPVSSPTGVVTQTLTPESGTISADGLLVTHDSAVTSTAVYGTDTTTEVWGDSGGFFFSDISLLQGLTGSHATFIFRDAEFLGDVTTVVECANSPNTVITQEKNVVYHGNSETTINGGDANDQVTITQDNVVTSGGSTLDIDLKQGSDQVTINGVPAGSVNVADSGTDQGQDTLTVNGNAEDNDFLVTKDTIEVDGQTVA